MILRLALCLVLMLCNTSCVTALAAWAGWEYAKMDSRAEKAEKEARERTGK